MKRISLQILGIDARYVKSLSTGLYWGVPYDAGFGTCLLLYAVDYHLLFFILNGRHRYCVYKFKAKCMNVKRIFGTILTVLGIIGLIYTGYELINKSTSYRSLIVIGVIGLIFFSSGIGLVKNTKDEA